MTSIVLLLMLRENSADSVLQRYVKAMHDMPSYEAHLTAEIRGRPFVHASLLIDGRKSLLFHANAPGSEYILSDSPAGDRELDFGTKTYDQYPYPGENVPFKSVISLLQASLPVWLLAKDLHELIPANAAMKVLPSSMVSGKVCDEVVVNFKNSMGSGVLDFFISRDGLVYRYKAVTEAMGAHSELNWDIASYEPLRAISASRFFVPVPDGFMPRSLAESPGPAGVGTKPLLAGWIDPATHQPWAKPSGRPVLFLLAGHDSVPSDRAVSAAKGWQSALAQKGVTLAIGSDASSSAAAKGLLFDPNQQSLQKLSAPETPMFYLIDAGGTVRNLWMGFVPTRSSSLRADVLKAVSALN